MKVKPVKTKIFLELKEAEKKTASGIYIPDSAKEDAKEGIVRAIGDSKDIPVKVGDKVIFDTYNKRELTVDGKKYLLIDAKDILATIE